MPKRIQLQRTKGWRMPAGALKVDRSTRWGNPYRLERQRTHKWVKKRFDIVCSSEDGTKVVVRHNLLEREATRTAVELFRDWIIRCRKDLDPLRGKDLACWCKPGEPCHADVLLELANR